MKRIVHDVAILIIALVYFVVVAYMFTNCTRPTAKEHYTKEVIKKDSLIYLPAATVEKSLPVDSISELLSANWYHYFDSLGRAQISFMRDKFNRLQMRAKCPNDTLKIETVTIREKQHKTETVEKKIYPVWVWIILGASFSLFVSSVVMFAFVSRYIRRFLF